MIVTGFFNLLSANPTKWSNTFSSENEDSSHRKIPTQRKPVNSKAFKKSTSNLPLSFTCTMNYPEDKLNIFNELIINGLN